jgi:NAD(P)-dependent dehydrogenase (short-subunit alcohol dehydrogenase family)
MSEEAAFLAGLFGLDRRVAVVTGATGVLGHAIAEGLTRAGARVAVLGRQTDRATAVAAGIRAQGGDAIPVPADVLEPAQLEAACRQIMERWGRIDALINVAGGNVAAATVDERTSFLDLSPAALRKVVDLNLLGTLLPCQIFGQVMVAQGEGVVVNISSMAAGRALTRVGGYGAAKATIENLTRWLAVELARKYGSGLRVNAIAPGFFVGEQNRRLLLTADGQPTDRGRKILEHTPMGRFGDPSDLVGTVVWLCSSAAAFVTGVVVPVDGEFSAFSGV